MRALVTGATGLLGSNLVRQLRDQGHEVRALVRSPEKARALLGGLDVDLAAGDVRDVTSYERHLPGTDVVFHTAAYFREYFGPGDHAALLRTTNVDAVRDLLEAAAAAGVTTVVHTSSSGVIGARPDGSASDESTPPNGLSLRNAYFASKVAAEQVVREAVARLPLRVPMVLPGWMWGPGDAAPTSAGQLVGDFLDRRLPGVPPGGGQVTDARDVARGMIAAADKGASGERYAMLGPWVSLAEVLRLLEAATGVPAPRLRVPGALALGVAAVSEAVARVTGRPTVVTREGVRTVLDPRTVSSARAERELGVTFRPLAETVTDTVTWIRDQRAARVG